MSSVAYIESKEQRPLVPITRCNILIHPLEGRFYSDHHSQEFIESVFERLLPGNAAELLCVMPSEQSYAERRTGITRSVFGCAHTGFDLYEAAQSAGSKQDHGEGQVLCLPDISSMEHDHALDFIRILESKEYQMTPGTKVVLGGMYLEWCVLVTSMNLFLRTPVTSVFIDKAVTLSKDNHYVNDPRFNTASFLTDCCFYGVDITDEGSYLKFSKNEFLNGLSQEFRR
ncbi:MAG: hypothetical protein NUV98_02865 [Candidatus Roizmanbacteria bacterium]|nr:hypothetical protein [Candidatus Roizmanbacteria bacterium]